MRIALFNLINLIFYLMQKKTTALTGQTSNATPPAISAGPSGVFGGLL
jgi:hypothetical protein